jgi:hypothetical protein
MKQFNKKLIFFHNLIWAEGLPIWNVGLNPKKPFELITYEQVPQTY